MEAVKDMQYPAQPLALASRSLIRVQVMKAVKDMQYRPAQPLAQPR
jgi:hypothetical protein